MINNYGADAVRWFILSDSPPEKDIQWSDTGVSSSNKFLQKIWDLNYSISVRKEKKSDKMIEDEFIAKMNNFIMKVDNSINDFRFNVSIASFYEIYKYFNLSINKSLNNKVLKEYIIKVNKLMIPFTPHLSHECLELHGADKIDEWPKINKLGLEIIDFAVQINGKTRDIIKIKRTLMKKLLIKKLNQSLKQKNTSKIKK